MTLVTKESDSKEASSEAGDGGHPKLGQLTSTAICGNDILSSCLYTAGLVATASGVYAPVSLFLVAIMLYFFRSVYG